MANAQRALPSRLKVIPQGLPGLQYSFAKNISMHGRPNLDIDSRIIEFLNYCVEIPGSARILLVSSAFSGISAKPQDRPTPNVLDGKTQPR